MTSMQKCFITKGGRRRTFLMFIHICINSGVNKISQFFLLILVDAEIWFSQVFFCRNVPPEFLWSFLDLTGALYVLMRNYRSGWQQLFNFTPMLQQSVYVTTTLSMKLRAIYTTRKLHEKLKKKNIILIRQISGQA